MKRLITPGLLFLYFTFIGGTFITDLQFWPRIIHHLIVTALLGIWLIDRVRRRRNLPPTPLDAPIVAYLLASLTATIWAVDPRVSLEALWQLGAHTLLFYLLVDLMRTLNSDAVMKPLFFSAAVVIMVGLLEFISWYFGLGWLPVFEQGWFEIGGLRDPIPPRLSRLTFTLSVPTVLSAYMALLIPVGLAWRIASHNRDTRQGLTLWLIGALIVEALTFSRGGILSLAVSLPTLGVLILIGAPAPSSRIRNGLKNWRVWALLGGALALVVIGGGLWLSQMSVVANRTAGDALRLDLWRSAWQIGLADPLSGVGPGGFGRAYRLVRDPTLGGDYFRSPDNYVLLAWSETGLPGVVALIWMAGTTAWVGWQRWRGTDGQERIRLAGICAALLGFALHNLVDAFRSTPNLLPCFALVAYLVRPYAGYGESKQAAPFRQASGRLAPIIALAAVGLSMVGWGISDLAQYHFERSIHLADSGDLVSALEAIETAQRIDPNMGFYAAQRAQYLGELALSDQSYLAKALEAYRTALSDEDSYELLHANYANLLSLSGDLESALVEARRAAQIRPDEKNYRLWIGELAERLGDEETARQAYQQALELPDGLGSGYWEATPVRAAAREEAMLRQGLSGVPLELLSTVSWPCWPILARLYRGQELDGRDALSAQCTGESILRLGGNPAEAVRWLERAIQADPDAAWSYIIRAEAYLALGDLEAAERDARTAIFLGDRHGHTVLGRIAEVQGDFEAARKATSRAGRCKFSRKTGMWRSTIGAAASRR